MTKKIFIPGRDKRERERFASDQMAIQRLANETAALELMVRHKRYVKYLRGSWWNQFKCWFMDLNPLMTYINKGKYYASRSIKARLNSSETVTGREERSDPAR